MGIAVLRGSQLLAYGVHTLRNGERPYDLIGQARRIVLGYIAEQAPQVVAIEAPLMLPTKRAAILSVIAQELHGRAKELNLEVVEITPQEVRQAVVGNPKATKIDVAEALVRQGFEELRELIPKRPARAALAQLRQLVDLSGDFRADRRSKCLSLRADPAETACSANLPPCAAPPGCGITVLQGGARVSPSFADSQGWQDPHVLAAGAVGAASRQGGAGDRGATGRTGRRGAREGTCAGAHDHGPR
jgi:Holliday junction resolvasome RuvABC endonuclease subunit